MSLADLGASGGGLGATGRAAGEQQPRDALYGTPMQRVTGFS
jgi:hypothetical protein